MCWRVARAIAAAEERFGRSPAAVDEVAAAFYDDDGRGLLPAQLADADERGQGQPPPVLGLLRAARGRLDAGDLRLGQVRRGHPPVGRRHRHGVLTAAAEERPRAVDRRTRLGTRVVPPRVQRGHGGGQAGRHLDAAPTWAFSASTTRTSSSSSSASSTAASRTSTSRSPSPTRSWTALAAGGEYDLVNPRTGLATGRLSAREVFDRIVRAAWRTGDPGHDLPRPHQPEPGQSHARGRGDRGDKSLW